MTTPSQFAKSQDRTYFNIHRPTRLWYDDGYTDYNKRGPLVPQSEVDRQTGSGRNTFKTMPVAKAQYGEGPMKNNFDISVKAPVTRAYEYSKQYQLHAPVQNKIYRPLEYYKVDKPILHGGSFRPLKAYVAANPAINNYDVPNPAINNWKPGTRIPEPTRIYEYSSPLQVHSLPSDPIFIRAARGPTLNGRLSDDDFKPFSQTDKYFNTFIHVDKNPLVYKN
jgi:hypothetical protein